MPPKTMSYRTSSPPSVEISLSECYRSPTEPLSTPPERNSPQSIEIEEDETPQIEELARLTR
jgi:hypothetical protein